MPSHTLIKTTIEKLEFLFNSIFILAREGFNDFSGGNGASGLRARAGAVCVLDIEEGGGGFAPGVHVGGCAFFAPSVDFGGGGGGGGEEVGEGGGADHAVYEGDGVGDEDAVDGFGFVEDAGAGVEGGEVCFEGVEDVVD